MKYQSTWHEALKDVEPMAPLTKNIECDVCVIGGGIAGISCAYMLSKAGKKVVVLEKEALGDSVTARTTAFLTSTIDTDLTDMVKMFGRKDTKLIIDSHESAIDKIESIIKEENIECEFMRVPSYEVAFSDKGFKQFKEDADISNKLGHEVLVNPNVSFPFPNKGIFESSNQAKFHPTKYALALREKAIKYGAEFYERTEAVSMHGEDPVVVRAKSNRIITATDVVIATYNPFKQPWWYVFKKGMYSSYVYEIEIEKGLLPEAIFEDDDNPYFYFRIDKGESKDRMIIGGADHRHELKFPDKDGFGALDDYLKEKLKINDYKIINKWKGPILEQTDGLAYIGQVKRNCPHHYVATAFSGNGMTYGTLSGMVISDLILGKTNPYTYIYLPYRGITFQDVMRKGRDYTEEFVRGVSKLFRS